MATRKRASRVGTGYLSTRHMPGDLAREIAAFASANRLTREAALVELVEIGLWFARKGVRASSLRRAASLTKEMSK